MRDGDVREQEAIEFDFEDGVEKTCDCAFRPCEYIKFLVAPESVAKIGRGAFLECSILANLIIEADVSSIEG